MSEKLIRQLFDRNLLKQDEPLIIVDGLDSCLLGITSINPKVAVYDYWITIDILLKKHNMTFDEAQDSVDNYISEINKSKDKALPIFIKTINTKFKV